MGNDFQDFIFPLICLTGAFKMIVVVKTNSDRFPNCNAMSIMCHTATGVLLWLEWSELKIDIWETPVRKWENDRKGGLGKCINPDTINFQFWMNFYILTEKSKYKIARETDWLSLIQRIASWLFTDQSVFHFREQVNINN